MARGYSVPFKNVSGTKDRDDRDAATSIANPCQHQQVTLFMTRQSLLPFLAAPLMRVEDER